MARGTQHRKRRPRANARVAQPPARTKRPARPTWEDQLFFGRLRAHAKWMFVTLAAVFAISFVIFGVGSGSTGISSVLGNFFSGSSATGSSLAALQKQTVEHPKSAKAWLAYGNKLEQEHKDDQAITALTQYSQLRPKDQNVLLQLAGLYLRRAQDWDTLYTNTQARIQALAPTTTLSPNPASDLGKALGSVTSPIAAAVSSQTSGEVSTMYTKVIDYLNQRLDVYKKLAKLSPKDAITQYSLAQAAQDSGDLATAIAAYKAFLRLAPRDSQAPAARQTLKQLEAQQKASGAASGPTKTGTIGK